MNPWFTRFSNWSKQYLHRNKWVKRKATTGHRHIPTDYEAIKAAFLARYVNLITQYGVPAHLVINFDQTGMFLVSASEWTMEIEGTNTITIAPQIIYQGTTERCHPKNDSIPSDWHIHHSENHWSNVDTNKAFNYSSTSIV